MKEMYQLWKDILNYPAGRGAFAVLLLAASILLTALTSADLTPGMQWFILAFVAVIASAAFVLVVVSDRGSPPGKT